MSFTIKSLAFKNTQKIPIKYTRDGENISPPLEWENSPVGTKSFVLLIDDHDASNGLWNHWLIYNIPKEVMALKEGIKSLPEPAKFGKNSWKKEIYCGPCPTNGKEHTYHFKLYALNNMLKSLPHTIIERTNIEEAIKHHILAKASITAVYLSPEETLHPKENHKDIDDAMRVLNKKNVNQDIKGKACKEIEEYTLNK